MWGMLLYPCRAAWEPASKIQEHSSHFISSRRHLARRVPGESGLQEASTPALVMKSQALDVLFRLGTNQCQTPPVLCGSPCLGLCRVGNKCYNLRRDRLPLSCGSTNTWHQSVSGRGCLRSADSATSPVLLVAVTPSAFGRGKRYPL